MSYKKCLENKRVIFVGPSPNLMNKNLGNFIDSFDVIVRTNGSKVLDKSLWEDYGKETNIVYFNVQHVREYHPFPSLEMKSHGISWLCFKTVSEGIKKFYQKQGFNVRDTKQYCKNLILKNSSKRPQDGKDKIPCKNYIFIAGQVLNDRSIIKHSEWNQLTFIEKVIQFGQEHKIPVVYKPHPGLRYDIAKHGKKKIEDKCAEWRKGYSNFHVVNTSIYTLIQNSLFTACINSGSVIDNFVVNSPVYYAGRMLFTNTDAIHYNKNVDEGLLQMLNKEYNFDRMKKRQLQAVQWCRDNLLLLEKDKKENYKRFLKLTGFDKINNL